MDISVIFCNWLKDYGWAVFLASLCVLLGLRHPVAIVAPSAMRSPKFLIVVFVLAIVIARSF